MTGQSPHNSSGLPRHRHARHRAALAAMLTFVAAGSLLLTVGLGNHGGAWATAPALPLGDADLVETRATEPLAPGVDLTYIVRGGQPAKAKEIATTTRGPWTLSVLTIDPARARGHLAATYGPNLSKVETTTALVRFSGALAGVNASYFTIGNHKYPGDPAGLGLYRGVLLSDPADAAHEVDLVLDAKTNKVRIGRLTWKGKLKNRTTKATLTLEYLNHPPKVPKKCAKLKDPTDCRKSGGRGVEVVLDRSGCVVRSSKTKRGTVLVAGQSSIQATGQQSKKLLRITKKGCLSASIRLYAHQKRVALTSSTYGVAGRYQLTKAGRITAPTKTGDYYERHPRTVVGRTATGVIMLVTIDGGRPTYVDR